MVSWEVDPSGVADVVRRAGEVASGFRGDFAGAGAALQAVAGQTDSLLVNQALADYAGSQQDDMTAIFDRSASAIRGATQAATAYVQGDQEMAVNAQRNAAAAPDPSAVMPGGRR